MKSLSIMSAYGQSEFFILNIKTMTKIRIVREANPQDFETKINKLLGDSWKIKGNFCVDNENYLYLIMTKRAAKLNKTDI
jgi:hypothetical protein